MICLYSDGMRETIPENELRLLRIIRPYLLFDDNHDAYLKDDAPEEVHVAFSEYMVLIHKQKSIKEKYKAICEKLGCEPYQIKEEKSDHENDNWVNPFSVLDLEELDFIYENGLFTKGLDFSD